MEEKHICNCSKPDDDYLKKLELIAKGSYSDRTMKAMFISLIIFCCILVISISAVAIYGINSIHHYLMNTEVVERVTTTEEYIEEVTADEYLKEDYDTAGSIVKANNNTLNNSNLGVDNGNIKEQNSYKSKDKEKTGN